MNPHPNYVTKVPVDDNLSVLSVQGQAVSDEEWPDPTPIQHTLRTVEVLPLSIIPDPLQDWVQDVCDRMQTPLDFVATASIVMAGSVIGAGCGIKPKRQDDWLVVPNLWGGAVGRPSVLLKSPAIEQAMSPLAKMERAAKENHDSDINVYEAEL